MCGVTRVSFLSMPDHAGLSPRVRGHPNRGSENRISLRSIPACAGSPLVVGAAAGVVRVYPRVCGVTHDGAGGESRL